jgi:antitoxin (DNA-binding transcriptional repressor) of toxin-antitoxin stability system
MKKVGLYQAKTELSAIIAALEASGESVALTRHGVVVAEIHPPAMKAPKRGCLKSKEFFVAEDFNETELGWEDFWGEGSSSRSPAKAAKKAPRNRRRA